MSLLSPLIDELQEALIIRLEEKANTEILTRELLLPHLEELIVQNQRAGKLSPSDRTELLNQVLYRVLGLGPLEPLLTDSAITEIMVNGRQAVFIERDGKLEKTGIVFSRDEDILHIINRIVARVGRRIDESSPLVDARLPDGSRVNAVIPPLSQVGPVLTIRRFPSKVLQVEELVARGTLSKPMADFLRAVILAKQNLIISGSTGAGKTSTLNALAALVPSDERLITIEDTAEIRLTHPHLVSLESRPPNVEGAGEVTIRTLLKNALRMRPDRIIIGEVRGGEALDMLQAMNTGHQGSLTTVHANAPAEALLRMETMALMADVELPLLAIREQIKSAVHYVLQQERLPDGTRRIVEIGEMALRSDTNEKFSYTMLPLFKFDKVSGQFKAMGTKPERIQMFLEAGITVDNEWFR